MQVSIGMGQGDLSWGWGKALNFRTAQVLVWASPCMPLSSSACCLLLHQMPGHGWSFSQLSQARQEQSERAVSFLDTEVNVLEKNPIFFFKRYITKLPVKPFFLLGGGGK